MPQSIKGSASGDAEFQAQRDQVHQTRAALSRKLSLLQQRMTNSIDSACNAVDQTMDCASRARDAAQAMTHALGIKQLATRHPCMMMSIAIFVGGVLARQNPDRSPSALSGSTDGAGSDEFRAQPTMRGWLSTQSQHEIGKLENAAISAGVSLFRDWLDRATQSLKDNSPGR